MPGKTHSPLEFEVLLEELDMTRIKIQGWQVEYDLVWAIKSGHSPYTVQHPLDMLQCPQCDAVGQWQEQPDSMHCLTCEAEYPISGGVIEMIQ